MFLVQIFEIPAALQTYQIGLDWKEDRELTEDNPQLRFVYASWDAWHCHFINYLWLLLGVKRAMNYLVLQLQT
ncbi:hypothetical protein F2P79_016201 [Pimephales promelas]|nr:hypothetical protein F2P79_016201 [Pimephales promelas]